jgi:hypothetical protein
MSTIPTKRKIKRKISAKVVKVLLDGGDIASTTCKISPPKYLQIRAPTIKGEGSGEGVDIFRMSSKGCN